MFASYTYRGTRNKIFIRFVMIESFYSRLLLILIIYTRVLLSYSRIMYFRFFFLIIYNNNGPHATLEWKSRLITFDWEKKKIKNVHFSSSLWKLVRKSEEMKTLIFFVLPSKTYNFFTNSFNIIFFFSNGHTVVTC